MEASLIGPQGRTALGPAKLTIGRAADNNLVINDGKVSVHHAEIRPAGQYYSIVDLGSTNKTFVNEQVLTSGVPRPLQQGDKLRFGDTTYTYDIVNAFQNNQNKAAQPYERTILASPNEGLPRPAGGNTNYGGAGTDYSSAAQQEYLETLPSQQPSYMAPPPSYMSMPPGQSPSFTPTPSSYGPPVQQPYSGGQQPFYTPNQNAQPPQYVQPQPQFAQPQPQAPFIQPQPQPPQKRSPLRAIILAVLACVIILGGIGAFLLINTNNLNNQHNDATATANTNANAHATGTAHALATAHANATAIVTSHYQPFTTLAFTDPLTTSDAQWNSGSSCQFSAAGYQISTAQAGFVHECFSPSTKFGDFAYQVNMTINSGDCGGLVFRVADTNNFYMMVVCVNGAYDFGAYINGKAFWADDFTQMPTSTAIHQGTNQQNVVAIVVQGSAFNLYMNNSSKPIGVFTDHGNSFSQGVIGLLALDNINPTSVTYTNAELWT